MAAEQTETCSKKVRGMARRSHDLIGAMYVAAKAAQPITGRGIGYKLFTRGLIASMARSEMQRVYRLLKEAREQGDIPWDGSSTRLASSSVAPSGMIPKNLPPR